MGTRWFAVGMSFMACWLAPTLASWLAPMQARAQAEEVGAGVRLGLSADLFSLEKRTFSIGGTSASSEVLAYGLTAPRLGIDVGGFLSPQFALGVRSGLAGENVSAGDVSTGGLTYRALGYAEGRFVLFPVMALMLRAEAGATGTHGGNASYDAFSIGAQVGLHLHPVTAFSITPFVGFEYVVGSGTAGSRSGSVDGFTISVGLSTFGWITTESAPEVLDEPAPERAVERPVAPRAAPGEPTHTSSGWRVDVAFVGAEGLASIREVGGLAQLELSVASVTARFGACDAATATAGERSARFQALGSATASPTGVDERVVLTGWRDGLEVLAVEGSRIELCGATFEPTTAGREALARLLSSATE